MFKTFICALCILASSLAYGAPAVIVTGESPPPLEQLAAKELQKYLYAGTGDLLPIAAAADGDAIAVGTPKSNPLIRRLNPVAAGLGDQGYLLRTVVDGSRRVLIVTGNTPTAVLYGVYSLLEEYGFGFYLGGDAIPDRKPFRLLSLNISRKPAFKVRGTLPWYNFFNSPTAWDFEDYAWFFDQLVKTKNNFIGFHSYDFEPFAAYPENGKFVYGEPLMSTAVSCWSTVPMKTSEFGGNTAKYYATEYFGAGPALYRNNREHSIDDAQALLARAFDYGKSRGLKVCLGFEVTSRDPAKPEEIERLERRLRHVVATYPMLDYIWIWESEGLGLWPPEPPGLDSDMGAYYRRYEKEFAYLKDPNKIGEAVRLAVYTREAHRILREIAPQVRLVLSGWGGDRHLHCSDFYPGLDKVLPKDVIFSALDNIVVSDMVSAAYGEVSPDRERWPIPWFEYDGDQWFPQPNTERWANACRDALAKGSQGILGIHWRTRDVEESHAYMSQFAWDPSLTYEQFYLNYAERCFGKDYGARMASILMDLQSLGYRLIGGNGQPECGRFRWGSSADPQKVEKLEAILADLRTIRDEMACRPGGERHAERVAYLIATGEWALRYNQTASQLRPGGGVMELLNQAREKNKSGDTAEAARLASEGLERLAACHFDTALDTCARRLTNKGELGILATVNAKAYADYRAVKTELEAIAGPAGGGQPAVSGGEPRISPINPNSVWFTGMQMPIKAAAHGDDYQARVIYRGMGEADMRSINLRKAAPRYFEGTIPCPVKAPSGIEYVIELLDASGQVVERWPGADLMHQVTLVRPVRPSRASAPPEVKPPSVSDLRVSPGEGVSLVVEWKGSAGRCEIRRATGDGPFELIRTTSDTWFEDRDVIPGESYRYSITPLGSSRPGKTIYSSAQSPRSVELPQPTLTASPRPRKVRLQWPSAPLGVAAYLVYRAASPAGPWDPVGQPRPAETRREHALSVAVESGVPFYYRLAALDRAGKEVVSSEPVQCTALDASSIKPFLALDFADGLSGGSWDGPPAVEQINGVPSAHFENGNHIIFPHRPEFDPQTELTIEMWLKLESLGSMPVSLCHGMYDREGYFVQILGGRVRFFLAGVGTVDAGAIQPGKWYHVACTYDDSEMAVYLNGKPVGQRYATGEIVPSSRNLYIGRYDIRSPEFETDSRVAAVKLYSTALLADEVREEYHRLAGKLR